MSLERISNNYTYKQGIEHTSIDSSSDDVTVFGDSQIDENYSQLSPVDNSVSSQQVNLSNGAGGGNTTASQQEQLNQALTDYLENMVLAYEEQFQAVKDNNGWIAKGWDWFKNATGIGAGSNKVQKQIDELKKQIEELKKDSSKLNDVYKSVTGNELNDEELNNLINGQVDLSHSKIVESVSKYTQGQKMCTNIISGISSSLAVVGLIAGGVVAAPFTGGMSLGASAAAIGTLTAAGTAAYMVPQAVDGLSEKDGYSFKEVMQDVSNGVVNSAFSAIGMGAGKAVGTALGKTAINKTVAGLAASETTSLIIGDGIGIGNYLTEAAFNDDVDFSWSDLGKTAAVSTASSAVAGVTAFGVSSAIRPALTSGTTATSQIIGRMVSAGITGGSAGMSAAAVGGGANYLLSCAIDGKEVSFDEWLNASTENLGSAALSGFVGGMAFEAVHLAAGTPKPEGTVKTVKGTNEDGLKYTNYLDKNGNVLATDISNSDLAKIYGSVNNEQGLTQYDGSASSEGKIYDTTRTIRISYTNIPDVQSFGSQDGVEVFTQTPSDNYRADITLHDWADNSFYLGSGIVNGDNIPNPNAKNNVVYDVDYEVIYDDPITSELSGNTLNTPQLTQGTPLTQENGLVNAQNDNSAQLANPNSQNIDLVVDTTLAQLAVQQAQMASVQAQAQGGIISANATTMGIASSGNIPPVQTNPPQFGAGSNPPVQIQAMEETGIGNAATSSLTETTDPQLPTLEEIEQRTAFLKEKYPNMDDSDISMLAESNNTLYQNVIEFINTAKNVGINNVERYLTYFASSEEKTDFLKDCINRGIIKDNMDIYYLSSLSVEQIPIAIEFVKAGMTEPYDIEKICSLPKEQQSTAIELVKLGMTEPYDICEICSLPVEQQSTAIELLKAGMTNSYAIKEICSLPVEQHSTAIELLKAGMTNSYEIKEICSLPVEQQSTAFELLKDGMTNSYDIKKICSLPVEQQSIAFELVKAGMTSYEIKEICSLPVEQSSTAIELLKVGMTSSYGIEKICSLPKEQHSTAIELLKVGMTDTSDIEEICSSLSKEQQSTAIELVKAGMTNYYEIKEICSLPVEQQQTFIEFTNENKNQGYAFGVQTLQNNAGIQMIATKEADSKDSITDNNIKVRKTITIKQDGTITKSTAEINGDKTETWYYGQDRTVILNKIHDDYDIASQIEIVNNETGEPSYILYTKASETLEGAYETVRYDLSDYPEDMDVIEAIENGTIQGGKVLSSVSSQNGVTKYQENYEYDNSNVNRNYTQEVDETGKVKSCEYKYDITDSKGEPLLSMERNWSKNSDGTTTTTINGKKYTASFDEDTMIVTVTQDDGSSTTIDIRSKLSPYNPNNSFQETTFGDEETMQRAFFEFVKTLPADLLINFSILSQIDLVDDLESSYYDKDHILSTGLNLGVLSHEMGHGIDSKNMSDVNPEEVISKNQELIDIYNEEMDSFKLKYPELAQELIKYFSQTGGGFSNTGLSEFFAETNMLMTTYGMNMSMDETRSEYLVRYFPKTVAKIAELLGYNN